MPVAHSVRRPLNMRMHTPAADPPILRERIAAELQHGQPMTARQLATRLLPAGHASAYSQTRRALNQLEAAGLAIREHGRPWATPDQWRAR